MSDRRKLVAGNWKMNGVLASLGEVEALAGLLSENDPQGVDIAICPPATLISPLVAKLAALKLDKRIAAGAQDCHPDASGAHTGDIAAEMIADLGGACIIVGHSERRTDHKERNELVCAKAEAAHRAKLSAIVCVGETESERNRGEALAVVERQLDRSVPDSATGKDLVIAYEPVWAIGTGRTPTVDDIAEVHNFIRRFLSTRFGPQGNLIRILYGGSVKPGNAAEIFAIDNVDGGLIGGASLKAQDFYGIISAAG